jgi:predicted N-acetyltransferase YhbS
MADLVFRRAAEADADVLAEILCGAFSPTDEAARERLCRLAVEGWRELVVLADAGRPVAVAHVEPHRLRVGSCSVLKAEIGHVAVRPDLQGQGLGTRLMQDIVDWLPRERFQVSRLGGLMGFYERFGYEPFPRRYVTIPVPAPDAHLKGTPWDALLALGPRSAAAMRPYHPAKDHRAVHRLRYAAAMRPGALVLPTAAGLAPAGLPDAARPVYVYDRAGEVLGYLRGGLARVHAGDPELRYCLDELAVVPWDAEIVGALVKTLMARARPMGPTEIMARLPYDERLFEALTAAGIPFNILEMRQALDGNMMQVVDLYGALRAVAPELTHRIGQAGCCPWDGALEFRLPRLSAALQVSADRVAAVQKARAAVVLELSHAAFLKALFGLDCLLDSAPAAATLTGTQRVTAAILFPRLPAASGAWG